MANQDQTCIPTSHLQQLKDQRKIWPYKPLEGDDQVLWPVVVRKQIKSTLATFSSNDVWVERPLTKDLETILEDGMLPCVDAAVEFETNRVVLYLESDETFYERATFPGPREYHDHPDYKALIQSYLDDGWYVHG